MSDNAMSTPIALIFDAMDRTVKGPSGKALKRKFKGTVTFVVKMGANETLKYHLDLAPSSPASSCVAVNETKDADLIATISAKDLVALTKGESTAQRSFMDGKLKVKGNMGLAMKFNVVIGATRKTMQKDVKLPKSKL
mmetsp:Transcript_42504/g.99758  ORF Transcript_42504/g.99758 Transcript_42504/m.99758 type:complete len:138 (+) Transcript_42504:284-697(+)|eukprot:CAMPEP_0113301548 /NCGR_PEP_ID=MMETSP0010_2-20120614/2734_1 /TAXON_ID=216773 ORGANISM="Corethron hystrix, Strain 308" /NCGR_SAMPLE_ID=MMETSP0010_2 /ASSEMBLY_ACC=CAM_ASM_000155 /LENGTH=137 /DNA_ID=CAMNT_0000155195 /DNA_START=180 /DNA_END=593 /DNA_ORIENTATION=- /assembly_acc=CAM_ASM_000155